MKIAAFSSAVVVRQSIKSVSIAESRVPFGIRGAAGAVYTDLCPLPCVSICLFTLRRTEKVFTHREADFINQLRKRLFPPPWSILTDMGKR